MEPSPLSFRTIDLPLHAELSVAFRRDSYACSFGNDERFIKDNGADGSRYLDWLRSRISRYPSGHVHLWRGPMIIGQIELMVQDGSGYVNLFYLIPEARGSGAGDVLHQYAVELLQRDHAPVAALSVSPTNHRALRYYQRHGWRDLGARVDDEHVHIMELTVPPLGPERRV